MTKERKRNTNIDLIKSIAMFFVVFCHVVMTFRNDANILTQYNDLLKSYREAYSVLDTFLLYFCRCFGYFSNILFIISSAWLLLDNNKTKLSRIIQILADVLIISLIFLFVYTIILNKQLPSYYIRISVFPNTHQNNWYITAYIIVYSLHQVLNHIINTLKKRQLLFVCLVLFFIYFVINFLESSSYYYASQLMSLITVYLITGYIKKHHTNLITNKRFNLVVLIISLSIQFVLYFVSFFIGDIHVYLYADNNPILLIICLSLFNLIISFPLKENRIIYEISKLSMFVYLIHENILYRNLGRVELIITTLNSFGTSYILLKVLIITILIYIASIILSAIYNISIHRIVKKISNIIGTKIENLIGE